MVSLFERGRPTVEVWEVKDILMGVALQDSKSQESYKHRSTDKTIETCYSWLFCTLWNVGHVGIGPDWRTMNVNKESVNDKHMCEFKG